MRCLIRMLSLKFLDQRSRVSIILGEDVGFPTDHDDVLPQVFLPSLSCEKLFDQLFILPHIAFRRGATTIRRKGGVLCLQPVASAREADLYHRHLMV